jgi:hypothetical protein
MPPVSRHILYLCLFPFLIRPYYPFCDHSDDIRWRVWRILIVKLFFKHLFHSPIASSVFVSIIRLKTSCKLGVLLVLLEMRFQTQFLTSAITKCFTHISNTSLYIYFSDPILTVEEASFLSVELLKKSTVYGTRKFIIVFTRAGRLFVSWADIHINRYLSVRAIF